MPLHSKVSINFKPSSVYVGSIFKRLKQNFKKVLSGSKLSKKHSVYRIFNKNINDKVIYGSKTYMKCQI